MKKRPNPRPYQQGIIDECRQQLAAGKRAVMIALATGGGKTVIIGEIIRLARERGRKVIFIVDRIQLVGQAVTAFRAVGARVGILQGDNTLIWGNDDCIVASIQTIRSRGLPAEPALLVIDEAHVLHQTHIELMQEWSSVPVIGLSATPLRDDLGQYFDALVRGPSIQEMTAARYLVPVEAYCPGADTYRAMLDGISISQGDYAKGELSDSFNQKTIVGGLVKSWQQRAADRPTLVFAIDIAHSKAVRDEFQAAGIEAAHLDHRTDPDERQKLVQDFKAGRIQVLCSVAVLAIGFDAPNASCAILARPTLSEALHIQQVGRILRTLRDENDCELVDDDGNPLKTDALILDHSGNILRFGMPEDYRVPELGDADYKLASKKRRKTDKLSECRECCAILRPDATRCHACGADRPQRSTDVIYADADLVKRGSQDSGKPAYTQEDMRSWYQAFLWNCQYGRKDGKPRGDGAAWHMFMKKFPDVAKPDVNAWCRAWKPQGPAYPTPEQTTWMRNYWKQRFLLMKLEQKKNSERAELETE